MESKYTNFILRQYEQQDWCFKLKYEIVVVQNVFKYKYRITLIPIQFIRNIYTWQGITWYILYYMAKASYFSQRPSSKIIFRN